MEYRRNAGRRNLAGRTSRQGDCDCAEFVGDRICAGGSGRGIVLRYANWRAVFFVGILPALVTLWIRSRVPESEMWIARFSGQSKDQSRNQEQDQNQSQNLEPQRTLRAQRTSGRQSTNLSLLSFARPISRARSPCSSSIFWIVWLVGIVSVDSGLSFVCRSRGRTRLQRDGHDVRCSSF